jgi:hypothetical protein
MCGFVPSPLTDAAANPARSTTTTETLKPSFAHRSIAPSTILRAIFIETFFSICGAWECA